MGTWNAKGRLRAHWASVGGRDALAERTGILATALSSYNTGKRPLGLNHAKLIAAALGITIYDLGAPTAQQEAAGAVTVLERLDALETDHAELRELLAERERPAVAVGDHRRETQTTEPPGELDRDPREDGLPSREPAEDRDELR